jgi:hypothetical protein
LFVEDLLSPRKAVCSVSSSPLIFSAGALAVLGTGKDERLFIVVICLSRGKFMISDCSIGLIVFVDPVKEGTCIV